MVRPATPINVVMPCWDRPRSIVITCSWAASLLLLATLGTALAQEAPGASPVAELAQSTPSAPAVDEPADSAPSVPEAAPALEDELPPFPEEDDHDPLQGFNRAMFTFNDKFDRYLARPVAEAYQDVTPRPIRIGISNFFSNLFQPTVVINNLLQGKVKRAGVDSGRFLVNTTVGVLGLFDIATPMGLPKNTEDLGQTLGWWGIEPGPYLVLPFLGPRNTRDAFGLVGDWYTDPVSYIDPSSTRWGTRGVGFVDTRAQLLGASAVLEQAAGEDSYIFVREAYRQRRRNQVYDGNPPPEPFPFEE